MNLLRAIGDNIITGKFTGTDLIVYWNGGSTSMGYDELVSCIEEYTMKDYMYSIYINPHLDNYFELEKLILGLKYGSINNPYMALDEIYWIPNEEYYSLTKDFRITGWHKKLDIYFKDNLIIAGHRDNPSIDPFNISLIDDIGLDINLDVNYILHECEIIPLIMRLMESKKYTKSARKQ